MEYVPLIIGLFFSLSWTYGVFFIGGIYATKSNIFTVIWWWLLFGAVFLMEMSFWHLLWTMPLVPIFCVYKVIGGAVPIALLYIYKYLSIG